MKENLNFTNEEGGYRVGNLIKNFWTYQEYYGITEVVGGPLEYRKVEGKHETRIEKALEYMLTPGLRLLSHMSIQTYNTYLNRTGRNLRDETEKAYYPMFIELETKVKPDSFKVDLKHREMAFDRQYKEMLMEAYLLVTYLVYEIGMEEKDILILLNNSRSIYVMLNPVSYGLTPDKDLHIVYNEMYKLISEGISLEYVDDQMYKHNGLMKTPNTWYSGGYFVPISYQELRELKNNPGLKGELTKNKRSLNNDVPGSFCPALAELYEKAKENSKTKTVSYKLQGTIQKATGENKVVQLYKPGQRNCVNYIHGNEIEDGRKNFALVSVTYHYKGLGYSQEQTYEILQEIADNWDYESPNRIYAKVKSVYRNKKKFSCDKARETLGLDECTCENCPFNPYKKVEEHEYKHFNIQRVIVDALWRNKASLRHYKALLQLSRNRLFNRWFSLSTEGLQERTIKELCKLSGSNFIFSQNDDSVMVYNKVQNQGPYWKLPIEFWDNGVYNQFGEQLKHYLKLLFCGYKVNKGGSYIQTRVGMERIQELLGYKTINGVYKLLLRLKELGFAVYNRGKLFAIYLQSYKIINIEDRREKRKYIADIDFQRIGESVAAGGKSLIINKNMDNYDSPDTG